MAITTRTFNTMLNEYITNDLVSEALLKRDWLLQNVEKDNGWKGGTMPVPFYGTKASSIKMGSLTDASDISQHSYVRGTVSGYKEAWGSLRFEHGDLIDHDGKVNEKSFLKILPNQVDEFGDFMKEQMSKMLLSGPVAASFTADTDLANGVATVDRIERLVLDQKLILDDGNSNQTDVYVIGIDLNLSTVTLSATRGGAALDISAYTTAQSAKLYYDGTLVAGAEANTFSNLKSMLLSAANGGSSTLYGVSKLAYPHLQAINISGAAITSSNIKSKLFDAYNEVRKKARGNANTILMSFKWLGHLMAAIETTSNISGNFNVSVGEKKASLYGWSEIVITSVKGTLKVVGIQEMEDDCIMLLDMSALKYYSNGEVIRKRVAPDGKQYYEVRATSGYYYILDMCALGELVLHSPTKCGIIHSIP